MKLNGLRNDIEFVFSGTSSNNLAVRVGSSEHANGGKVIKLKRYVQQPKYNSAKIDFDFSLLELAESLTFNDQIQPVALPKAHLRIPDGTLCLISGWGNEYLNLLLNS